jgi:C4-dicarboxylate-specific signal transduction histidine kinase
MRQAEWVPASRVANLEQLSASIGEINQPISALVMNAEAALQVLRAQPTNTGAVRRLLACIVKDGLRTGDIVRRTRALIEKAQPVGTDSPALEAKMRFGIARSTRKPAAR